MFKIMTEALTVLHLLCLSQILQVESGMNSVLLYVTKNRRYRLEVL